MERIMEVWVGMLRQEPIEMHKLMERVKGRDNNSVGGGNVTTRTLSVLSRHIYEGGNSCHWRIIGKNVH